jgi:uncharacterized protein YceK
MRKLCVLLVLVLLSGCSGNSAVPQLDIPEDTFNTDIQTRLVVATEILWEDGRMDGDSPYGFVQRLIPTNVEECNIDVFVFRTDELAKNAKAEVTSWGWSGIWQFEDPSTNYGIFLGERDEGQPCTNAAASAFEMILSR